FWNSKGEPVGVMSPSLANKVLSGTTVIASGETKDFRYSLDMFSPPLKPGDYTIQCSFIQTDPIKWTIPEQGVEGNAANRKD
ncbi:MAG: hypothetical protein Q8O19_02070, partial [Rectinemataceae bacterium]|nr:hypothetical protein [Rectinemataceae bacterium]